MKIAKTVILSLFFGMVFGAIFRLFHLNATFINLSLDWLALISDIFIKLIKMIVPILIFTTLSVGIANLGNNSAGLGRLFYKSFIIFLLSSCLSLSIGWIIVDILQPGVNILAHIDITKYTDNSTLKIPPHSLLNFIKELIPENITLAFAESNIIQIVVFSILFGLALAQIPLEQRNLIQTFMNGIMNTMFTICKLIMKLVPLVVFASISHIIIKNGFAVLYSYLIFILGYYFALLLVWMVLYLIARKYIGKKINILIKNIFRALSLSFATSSSEVAYPSIFEELDKFGIKKDISSFVLSMGYSFNMIGSMVYFSFAMIFLTQTFGIHLDFLDKAYMFFVLLITSKGIAGVPRASIMVIASVLIIFHIPQSAILLLIPIDAFADMGRSATNVFANTITSVIVDKWEQKADKV